MKVLLVNHFPLEGSGSGIYTKNIASKLTELGHEVMVILPEHTNISKPYITKSILFRSEANKGEKVDAEFNFPCFTTHPKSNNTFYQLTDEQMHHYIDLMQIAIDEAVATFKPDIIHCQHLWIAPYCASKTGVPYVATAHGTDLKGLVLDSRYVPYALEGAQKSKKIITISKQVDYEVGEKYSVPDSLRRLILNGFDESIFNLKSVSRKEVLASFGLPDAGHVVSFVGKLAHFKGVDLLLKAAKIYEEEVEDVMTLIVGHGELYDELNNLRRSLGLKHVYLLGHQHQEKVADIYNIADVSTVPSRKEPFGLVAIEALACGTPVVVTNGGGLVDFVDDTIGSVIDEEDYEALAKSIILEIKNPDKKAKRKRAHEFAMKEFSWNRVINEVIDVYEKAIKG